MKTKVTKQKDIKRVWHFVDLKDQVLGRTATQMAKLLIGKDKPDYTPNLDGGDYVVAINAEHIQLTRKKADNKIYRHHTGFPGGFREIPFSRIMEKDPTKVVEKAVSGMLPKNKLRTPRLRRLKVFVGDAHPYKDKFEKSEK
ncbi:50S ribosomal protein L13 [Patescibacteria group bacterium]